ncbi:MAG: hypothetical protein ABR581_00225, partial [Thermoleophilaceae bacterium]
MRGDAVPNSTETDPRASELSQTSRSRSRRRFLLTGLALVLYLAFSVVAFTRWSLLTSRDWIWIWLLGGLLSASLADLRGAARGLVLDWLPFMAMILAYDLLRGLSDGLVPQAHSRLAIDADRFMFAGHLPTVDLQRSLFHLHDAHWWDYPTWGV